MAPKKNETSAHLEWITQQEEVIDALNELQTCCNQKFAFDFEKTKKALNHADRALQSLKNNPLTSQEGKEWAEKGLLEIDKIRNAKDIPTKMDTLQNIVAYFANVTSTF